ncbi:MAG TPA: hypothetical protein VKQ30_12415 [Ktedonobacterales bacterium]|nr:hypothetical protein [Ktedonobacterales bacterium]
MLASDKARKRDRHVANECSGRGGAARTLLRATDREESCGISLSELERLSQPAHRIALWGPVRAAFEITEAAHAYTCALGQFLLRKPSLDAMATQQLPKIILAIIRHLLTHPMS